MYPRTARFLSKVKIWLYIPTTPASLMGKKIDMSQIQVGSPQGTGKMDTAMVRVWSGTLAKECQRKSLCPVFWAETLSLGPRGHPRQTSPGSQAT